MARRRKEKKKKILTKGNLIGLIIVSIMVLSGVGYMLGDQKSAGSTGYNGHRFTSSGNMWYFDYNGNTVGLGFHPTEIQDIKAGGSAGVINSTRMLYLSFDPDSRIVSYFEVARMELSEQLGTNLGIYVVPAVTNASPEYSSFPIATCANATAVVPVLELAEGNETKIITQGQCVILQAREWYDVQRLEDRLLYSMYGIMGPNDGKEENATG
jgi:hypothetical protein